MKAHAASRKNGSLSKVSRSVPIPAIVFALLSLSLCLHAFVYTTSHCGLCPDEGYILQSVSRAHKGFGLTSLMQGKNIEDLSNLKYAYLVKWPPGISWLLLGLVTIGLDIALAYKLLHFVLLMSGSIIWLLLAGKVLSSPEWMVFGLAMVTGGIGFSGGKLSDIAMWATFGAYLGLLFRENDSEDISSPIWSWRSGALLGLGGLFWYGGIFFSIGGAIAAGILSSGNLKDRFSNSMKCAVPGVLVFLFIYALNRLMGGSVPGDYKDSSFTLEYLSYTNLLEHFPITLEHFSFANLIQLGGILTANLFGAKALLMRLALNPGWQTVLRIIEPIVTAVCLVGGISCIIFSIKTGKKASFLLVVFWHVAVLLGFLLFLSVRQPGGLTWTYFTEVRYWTPLISAAGIVLVGSLGVWWRSQRKDRGLPLVWAISLMLAIGTTFGLVRSVKTGITACCSMSNDGETPIAREFIWNLVQGENLEPFVIFDNLPTAYIWDGKMEAAPWLDPETMRQSQNSRRLFVFVVMQENPFTLSKSANAAEERRHHAEVMIDKLKLPYIATVKYNTKIYGDWVEPFKRGAICQS